MTDKTVKRPRITKLHCVISADGEKVYVKAKTKSAALNYVINNHFRVETVSQKDTITAMEEIAEGAPVHDAND